MKIKQIFFFLVKSIYCYILLVFVSIAVVTASQSTSSTLSSSENQHSTALSSSDNQKNNSQQSQISIVPQPSGNYPVLPAIVHSTSLFGNVLYNQIIKGVTTNIVFSPFSLDAALALLYYGAGGKTARQFEIAFQYPKQSQLQVAQEYGQWLYPLQTNPLLQSATGLFVMNNYNIQPNFLSAARKYFYSIVESVDFLQPSTAANTINNWVSGKTHNKINKLIKPTDLDSDTVMVLVNALYFKGQWQHPFIPKYTKKQVFYERNGKVMVDMMYQFTHLNYGRIKSLNSGVVELPYVNSDISMLIILPDQRNGINTLNKNITNFDFTQVDDYLDSREVILSLPKFKIEYTIDLKTPLEKMGLTEMFSSTGANFNDILETRSGSIAPVFVSKIIQKAYIDVNEKGAEAAAATEVTIHKAHAYHHRRPTPTITFTADHPFIYVLRTSSQILFMGQYLGSS